jgi:hypothetical protein
VTEGFAATALKHWMMDLTMHFPGEIGEYVDWHRVEALGAVGSYPADKAAQRSCTTSRPRRRPRWKPRRSQGRQAAAKKAAEEFAANHIEIMPGQHVKKIQLQRAA